MNKWNCLVIDDTIINNENEDILKLPDEIRVEITNWNNFEIPNLEDFDVFFIKFEEHRNFSYYQTINLLILKSGELKQIKFIFASKILCELILAHQEKQKTPDLISSLWKGIPQSTNKKGNKIHIINPEYTLSKLIFNEKNQQFCWNWAIKSEELPNNSYTLAKNKKGNIISLIVGIENNFLIFLPHPKNKLDFIKTCLENIDKFWLELYKKGLDFIIKRPKWLEDYDPFKKKRLIDKLHTIEEKIRKIETYEILLYGHDKLLENSISTIFSSLGFQNIAQTVDRADLLCETEKIKMIAEIKGLKGIAHERNIKQMYKWRVEELEKGEENVKRIKQIFICNAYRNKKLEERGNFFDQKVIKIAESQDWGLLSTRELYKSLLKIWKGELRKEEVISIIENQKGIIVF